MSTPLSSYLLLLHVLCVHLADVLLLLVRSAKTKEELWRLRELLSDFGGIPKEWGKKKGQKRARELLEDGYD